MGRLARGDMALCLSSFFLYPPLHAQSTFVCSFTIAHFFPVSHRLSQTSALNLDGPPGHTAQGDILVSNRLASS